MTNNSQTKEVAIETKELKNPLARNKHGLNPKQEAFCQYYTGPDIELYGNGTTSYIEAYGADYALKYKKPLTTTSAQVAAFKMLRSNKIIARINMLLKKGGFNEVNVDKQHLFLINQFADFKVKLGAVKEFNELKKRKEIIQGNNFFTFIQQVINEPKGNIIEGRIKETEREALGQKLEDAQLVSHSEQGREEDSIPTEQTADLLTGEPSLQELHS